MGNQTKAVLHDPCYDFYPCLQTEKLTRTNKRHSFCIVTENPLRAPQSREKHIFTAISVRLSCVLFC